MAIVMREYNPRPEILAADKRIFSLSYQVEGPYPDYDLMTEEERCQEVLKEIYFPDAPPHIEFIRRMPLAEHRKYIERILGKPLSVNSFLQAVHRTRESINEELDKILDIT